MTRYFYAVVALGLISAIPLCAANRPQAETDRQKIKVWTNDELEKLRAAGLISIVGQVDQETSASESAPRDYETTPSAKWYAEQGAKLRHELEYRQAQLREYRQALEDARSLKESTGGMNLVAEDLAITPEAGIEILQQRVSQAQAEFDALEDLARRNDVPPGTLRGQ